MDSWAQAPIQQIDYIIKSLAWVTVTALVNLLGRQLNPNAVKRDPSVDDTVITRTLLRHDSHYVAIVDGFDRFEHLIDRHIALDQVVRREMTQAK